MSAALITDSEPYLNPPLRVLLVEDDPEYVRLVEHALRPTDPGIQVRHVGTLGAALVEQDRDPCDAILLDLGLPDSEPENTTASAARSLARSAPVFVLTGRDDRASALRALEAGVDDYFVKDQLDPATLSEVLRTAVLRFRERAHRDVEACLDAEGFRCALRDRIARLRSGASLRVSVIELDYFDTLREMWGEAWARRMLRSAVDALRAATGDAGLVADLGQGTLAVLDEGLASARPLSMAALKNAMDLSPDVSHRERYSVTASQGAVSVPEDGTHPASLIALARDRAQAAFRRSEEGPRFRLDGGEAGRG